MHRIRVITLDLDDTLWEIAPVIHRAEAELLQWLSQHYPRIPQLVSPEDALEMRSNVSDEFPDRSYDFRFLRKQVLARIAIYCGYSEDLVGPAFEVFDVARNRIEFYPEVLPVLEKLSTRYRLIAVTNGNASLQRIGVRHLFHDVVTAVDAGAAKPAKPIFEEAVRRAGVDKEHILHVGDHPENDVEGARNAGLRSAWMNRAGISWPARLQQPDAIVSNMTDLLELLLAARNTG